VVNPREVKKRSLAFEVVDNAPDLIAFAKADPGKLSMASPGNWECRSCRR
jgi:hypothetical protein